MNNNFKKKNKLSNQRLKSFVLGESSFNSMFDDLSGVQNDVNKFMSLTE